MRGMHAGARFAIVWVAIATVASACSSSERNVDKAGGSGVVLRMATVNGDLDFTPQIQHLVERVEELSDGNVQIDVAYEVGAFAPDAEQEVVRGVSEGRFDLGFVGTHVFESLGVTSLRALTAPMLIDSYELEDAVIASGITDPMMEGLDEVGVTGLGVMAGALRKPIAVDGPLLGLSDWKGITFATFRSEGQTEAIQALAASPTQVIGDARDQALEDGSIHGFESGLLAYRLNGQEPAAPYVAANVNLWPQTLAVFGNPDAIALLTDEQRGWLEQAADDAAQRSTALVDTDALSIEKSCEAGARFALASETELGALHEAFDPVYAALEQDAQTKGYIERIRALKGSTPAGPTLAIPSNCTGKAPEQANEGTGTEPAHLNGTYRFEITLDEAKKADEVDPEDTYPIVDTMVLEDGHLEGGCFGSGGATYSVEDDRITFHSVEYDETTTVTFTRDEHGNLHLTPVPPIDPGAAWQCFSQVWTKIG
jgi:TRAP-type C4-dicarboxylate transport system substrate-binding protein